MTTTRKSNTRAMVVSLIGRPNVGKSSLYNRLMKKANAAIIYDAPGVTRDRHYGIARLDEHAKIGPKEFILVDTGGFYPEENKVLNTPQTLKALDEGGHGADPEALNFKKFFNIMTDHAKVAIDESDLILFVTDVREGLVPFDESIMKYIRQSKKKCWVLANKFDSDKQSGLEAEFYALGVEEEELLPVSAAHGLGLNDLMRRLQVEIDSFEKSKALSPQLQKGVTPREMVVARVAIVGAPNAGKSTLLNQLIGAQRALVSDIPGTTVDPIEGFFDLFFGPEALELDELKSFPHNNELLFQEYQTFRDNNQEVFNAMTMAYELEQIEAQGGDETVEVDRQLEEMANAGELDALAALAADQDQAQPVDEESLQQQLDDIEQMQEEVEVDLGAQKMEVDEKALEGSFWRSIHLVDTAGIRKQGKVEGDLESHTVYRTLRCINEADIVIHLLDISKGISHQDRRLIDIALERGKSVIVGLNKIDLMSSRFKDEKAKKEWLLDLRAQVPWLSFCDLIPMSAKYSKAIGRLKDALKKTIMVRHRRVSTGELNRALFHLVEQKSILIHPTRGVRFKVKYASQVKSDPPTFLLFTNKSMGIPEHYRRYLQNGLRQGFNLYNSPVHLIFRTGHDLALRMKRIGHKAKSDEGAIDSQGASDRG